MVLPVTARWAQQNSLRIFYLHALLLDYVEDARTLHAAYEQLGSAAERLSLAASLSEERGTVEDVLEPFLIQQGYILRASRGRMATSRAYRHFGLAKPGEPENDLFQPED